MRTRLHSRPLGEAITGRRTQAFTFSEVMIASALVMVVIAAFFVLQYATTQMLQLTKAKLGASNEARTAISKLVDEIRSAKILRVGTGDLTSFVEASLGTIQAGNALQVYASTNTNSFVRYFWDGSDRRLKRTTNGASSVFIVANAISNRVLFTAEDYRGNPITNNQNNRVIHLRLEFFQIAYPVVAIGPGGLFDYYQLSTRITRRALE